MIKLLGHMPAQLMCVWVKDDNDNIGPIFMAQIKDPENKGMAKYIPLEQQDSKVKYDIKEFTNMFQHYLNIEKEKLEKGE